MSLLDLLNKSKEAAPARRSNDDEIRLRIIDMSRKSYEGQNGPVPTNQGTIKFLPVKSLSGQEVKYAYDVKIFLYEGEEYNTPYRVMDPEDYETELTDDDKALILQARSLIDHYGELGARFPYVDYKSYSLIMGYVLEHVSIDGDVISDKDSRYPALLVFPSKNVSKAMTSCLIKMQGYGEDIANEMYEDLFSRNTTRSNYLTISFNKGAGYGYDCEISADSFDRKCVKILTKEELQSQQVEIPEDVMKYFTEMSAVFFANDRRTQDDFEEGEDVILKDFDNEYCQKVVAQLQEYIDYVEENNNKAEKIPPIPSKNKRQKSDLDE